MIPHNRWRNRPEYEDAVLRVLRRGHPAAGEEVVRLEHELAERFRPGGEAVCVSSGTAALRLACRALEVTDISVPTYACPGLWHAIEGVREPGLVDCAPGSMLAHASVFVDTYGETHPVFSAVDWIYLVEDFTHAPGVVGCGNGGLASVVSFGATKPLGVGGGGAVLASPSVAMEIRDMIDYDARTPGVRFNYTMNDLHAALVRERLRFLDEENDWRLGVAGLYYAHLTMNPVRHKVYGDEATRVWYRFVVRVEDLDRAVAHCASHGVEAVSPLEPDELLHRREGYRPRDFPNAEDAAAHALSVPIWPGMTDEETALVARTLETLP